MLIQICEHNVRDGSTSSLESSKALLYVAKAAAGDDRSHLERAAAMRDHFAHNSFAELVFDNEDDPLFDAHCAKSSTGGGLKSGDKP